MQHNCSVAGKWFYSVFFLVSFTFGVSAFAGEKTEADYWKDLGLKFSDVEKSLTDQYCYQSEAYLQACANAVNQMLGYGSAPLAFIPEARRASEGYGAATASFGSAAIATPPKKTVTSTAAAIRALRQEREANQKSWTTLFKDTSANRIAFSDVWKWFRNQSFFTEFESPMVAEAKNGVLHILKDPHTSYLPKAYWDDMNKAGASNFVGIGAPLSKLESGGHTYALLASPFEGSPAEKAGLQSGDLVIQVNAESVVDKALDYVVSKIRGAEGTTVELTVRRGLQDLTVKIVRAKIVIKNLVAQLQGAAGDIGYLKLRSFVEYDASGKATPCAEMKTAIKDLTSRGAKSLVFDLRDNGGGLLTEAECISNLFLDLDWDEPITFTKELGGSNKVTKLPYLFPVAPITSLPLIVLIDEGSASASEIVAGALQDYHRAYLIGVRTFGKATVQNIKPAANAPKQYFKETIARFYLPSGRTNQIVSVLPDLERYSVPKPTADEMIAFREEDLYSALPPLSALWKQTRPGSVQKLETCLQSQGTAEKTFQASATPRLVDFQKLVAFDAAACVISEGLWDPKAKRPKFSDTLAEQGPPNISTFMLDTFLSSR